MTEANNSFRDRVSTVDEQGKRIWVYAKKPKGKFFNYRVIVAVILLILFLIGPFLSVDGEPFFLFDFIRRKFVLFGQVFFPQDFLIFGIAMLTFIVFIVFFTVIYGRIWCGWACPQTIFMEMIFRRIEYWLEGDGPKQKRIANKPLSADLVLRKTIKHTIFFTIAFAIGNYILLYPIGKERLFQLISEGPMGNFGTFSALVIFSFAVYGNFAWLREQACTLICPYGRLQGVLLDTNSLIVAYDYKRGEPRGHFRPKEDRALIGKGHCIDCNNCVAVCPTGIDIRNGTQLECVNCTACIDACNPVMEKHNLPRGLIRFASEKEIEAGEKFRFTPRIIFYSVVLVALLAVLSAFIFSRNKIETTILRVPGTLYFEKEDGQLSNLYNIRLLNNSKQAFTIELKLFNHEGNINVVGDSIKIQPLQKYEGVIMVIIDKNELNSSKEELEIGVFSNGEMIEKKKTVFVGP